MKILSKIKTIITLRLVLGIAIGAIAGYAYYYFIGCSSGSCAITSSPVNSTIWGMLFGGLLFFKEKKAEKETEPEVEK